MAYNKHNTDSVKALMNNLGHLDGEPPEPPLETDTDEDETCTCITTTIISGHLSCTRCPNPRPNDPFSNLRNQPINTFTFTGEFIQQAECGAGDPEVKEPGDTYTHTVTDGGSEEDCVWSMSSINIHNKGDCECCGAIWINAETVVINSIFVGECTEYGQQQPKRIWNWDGQGAQLLFNVLMMKLKDITYTVLDQA